MVPQNVFRGYCIVWIDVWRSFHYQTLFSCCPAPWLFSSIDQSEERTLQVSPRTAYTLNRPMLLHTKTICPRYTPWKQDILFIITVRLNCMTQARTAVLNLEQKVPQAASQEFHVNTCRLLFVTDWIYAVLLHFRWAFKLEISSREQVVIHCHCFRQQ